MSGFADEGIEYDDDDLVMNGGGGGMAQYLLANNSNNGNGNGSNANGNGFGMPPDVVMGDDDTGEFEYSMDVQDALQGGRSAGNLDDFVGGNGFGGLSRNFQREAEPQRVAPVELDFTVDTAAVVWWELILTRIKMDLGSMLSILLMQKWPWFFCHALHWIDWLIDWWTWSFSRQLIDWSIDRLIVIKMSI